MFRERQGGRSANSRARLASSEILYPAQAGYTAEPEIAVQGEPEPWLEIVTQMALEGADWFLRPAGRPEIDRNHAAIGR